MSAAPSSSMTSVQPRYENPAPPTDSGNGAAVRPSSPIRANSDAVVALGLVALDGARAPPRAGELAGGRLEEPLLLGQAAGHRQAASGSDAGRCRSRGPVFWPRWPAVDELHEDRAAGACAPAEPSSSTRMIPRQTSRPMKSASSSGPIGWLSPTRAPVSMSSARAHALLERAHRLGEERHEDPVDDEARADRPRR